MIIWRASTCALLVIVVCCWLTIIVSSFGIAFLIFFSCILFLWLLITVMITVIQHALEDI